MMQATQTRFDSIEIPDRPAVTAQPGSPLSALLRKRMVLWGGIAAASLLALIIIATTFSGSSRKVARLDGDAPLIKGGDQPLKVSPDQSAAPAVSGRDLLVYERMHGSPGGKPPVERLLPEPEQPLAPPQSRSAVPPAEPPTVSALEPLAPLEPAPVPRTVHAEPAPASPAEVAPVTPSPANPVTAAPAPAKPGKPAVQKPAAAPAKVASAGKSATVVKPDAAKVATAEKAPAKAASSGKFQVQLLAGRDADEVKDAWAKLKARNPDLLGPLSPNLARAELGDKGTFYRLRAGPLASEAKARSLCSQLSGRGTACIIIRPAT